MQLVPHAAVSGAAGLALWATTGEAAALPAALAAGVVALGWRAGESTSPDDA